MLAAIAFLTPFGRARTPTARTVDAMPVVGALIGLVVGGLWYLAAGHAPALVAAAVVVAADAALTGLIHLDGLADSADGLLAPMDRDRRLAVMRDPAVGAFGAVTLIVVLAARLAVFAQATAVPLTIGALWCAARTAMAVMTRTMAYARQEGIVTAFGGRAGSASPATRPRGAALLPLIVGGALAIPLAWVGSGWRGIAALAVLALTAALVTVLARRRLGGYTGDVLGAAGVLGETAGLIALVVHR